MLCFSVKSFSFFSRGGSKNTSDRKTVVFLIITFVHHETLENATQLLVVASGDRWCLGSMPEVEVHWCHCCHEVKSRGVVALGTYLFYEGDNLHKEKIVVVEEKKSRAKAEVIVAEENTKKHSSEDCSNEVPAKEQSKSAVEDRSNEIPSKIVFRGGRGTVRCVWRRAGRASVEGRAARL